MISVAIVHAKRDIREGLARSLRNSSLFRCTAVYQDACSVLDDLENNQPDILLLDVDLPDMAGAACIREVKKSFPAIDIIVYTELTDDTNIFTAFEAGAIGYLPADTFHSGLLRALEEVKSGGAPMAPFIARKVVASLQKADLRIPHLSEREEAVLARLCEGLSNKEIAEKLFISPNTVGFHLKNIYKKLEVNSRHEAINKVKNYLNR